MTNRNGKTGAVPLANGNGKTGAVPLPNRDGTAADGGLFRRETIHNQHRRSFWHDYHEAGLYMLTMVATIKGTGF